MKFVQTKPHIKNMNINFYDLYYSIIKNRDDKETVNDEHEDKENDYFTFIDLITPNYYVGRKKIM